MKSKIKVVAFVGETFSCFDENYYTKPTSAAFLQDIVGESNLYVCSPSVQSVELPKSYSTQVDKDHFHQFPVYSSTKDFAIKSIIKRGYLKSYQETADKVIAQHKGAYFWIRTPSIGSIVFGLQALKAGEKVFHHMCADASNTWRDSKYSFLEKLFGFALSRYIRYKLSQICKHENTINLCTGDVLENFSKKYSPNKTYQFVDLMVKPPKDVESVAINTKSLRLLFVGRIVEDKGIFDLIYSVKHLKGKATLTVVGDGPDLAKARSYVNKEGLDKYINFTGQLPHAQLSSVYNNSDAVVVPSNNHYEGFPRVIMEGWAHHKPVIVSNVGGVKAFVKDGENGLIFSPGDRVQLLDNVTQLINDWVLFEKIKEGAKEMADISCQHYWVNFVNVLLRRSID
jgi:glycosyltransferase involved in cell wall biosynthesis